MSIWKIRIQKWRLMPVSSALSKLGRENGCEFKASLDYNVKPCPKGKENNCACGSVGRVTSIS